MSTIHYRLHMFGRLVAELEIESDGFEVTIEPGDLEPEGIRLGDCD
jgi:hypothetical protein